MKNPPRKRRARPLLLASAGLAATLAGCWPGCAFGNLRAPDCDAFCRIPDLSAPIDAGADLASSNDGGGNSDGSPAGSTDGSTD